MALDADKNNIISSTSNQGHLLFADIINDPEKMNACANRLFEPDIWTPFGIRTLSDREPAFDPYLYHLGSIWFMDNWMIYYGLNNAEYVHPFDRTKVFSAKSREKELKEIMLNTACLLGGAPELHTCVNGALKTTDHVSGWGTKPANHMQAWSAAAILDLLREDLTEQERKK